MVFLEFCQLPNMFQIKGSNLNFTIQSRTSYQLEESEICILSKIRTYNLLFRKEILFLFSF